MSGALRDQAEILAADVERQLWARYERASFGGDEADLAASLTELTVLRAVLDLAHGRLLHTQFLNDHQDRPAELSAFERAAEAFGDVGDVRGEAEAWFWIGTYHQVVHGDTNGALPAFVRAGELAAAAGDERTLSYVERHLGFIDQDAGRAEQAQARFEESLRLRRKIGFQPGVAAALLALAECHETQGHSTEASRYLAESRQAAEASDARSVLRWIAEASAG